MKTKKQPSPVDAERCIAIRCQSKRGIRLHPDDLEFCEKMWHEFEAWYGKTEKLIFEKTKPFGSV